MKLIYEIYNTLLSFPDTTDMFTYIYSENGYGSGNYREY